MSKMETLSDGELFALINSDEVRAEVQRRNALTRMVLRGAVMLLDVDGSEDVPEVADVVEDIYSLLEDGPEGSGEEV